MISSKSVQSLKNRQIDMRKGMDQAVKVTDGAGILRINPQFRVTSLGRLVSLPSFPRIIRKPSSRKNAVHPFFDSICKGNRRIGHLIVNIFAS
jgi:hypothetical protein